ncbi:MAG TPA: 2Fe-2S iron-sulfur cluster-binding protein [Gemmatimonadales bacterium]|nr:2Fe-2S iron-sulfur cluster-binding protein [Gemmatimonadales bacterium]
MLLQALGVLIGVTVLAQAGYALYAHVRERRYALRLIHDRVERFRDAARVERQLNRRRVESAELSWTGYRKFEVQRKVIENRVGDVCSFYLVPHDRRPLPAYRPGQFLTFQLDLQSHRRQSLQAFAVDQLARRAEGSAVRCYSLSDAPDRERYRVTIKRIPNGLVSNFLHDEVQEGDILNIKAPSGGFILDPTDTRPIVLIGGGVGITPVLAMLNAVIASEATREVWFFAAFDNGDHQVQREHLDTIAKEHANVRVQYCYCKPLPEDHQRGGFLEERVSVDLLERLLPSNNYEFYICGPPPMMAALHEGLSAWGVPDADIRYEAFGPATVKKARASVAMMSAAASSSVTVTFAKSGKTCEVKGESPLLLDLAEKNGVVIDSGCRVGNCGTCLTALRSGEVTYVRDPDTMPEQGSCLACIAMPKTDVVLDA